MYDLWGIIYLQNHQIAPKLLHFPQIFLGSESVCVCGGGFAPTALALGPLALTCRA